MPLSGQHWGDSTSLRSAEEGQGCLSHRYEATSELSVRGICTNTGVPTFQGYLYLNTWGVHFAGEWIKSGHPCIPYKYPLKTPEEWAPLF